MRRGSEPWLGEAIVGAIAATRPGEPTPLGLSDYLGLEGATRKGLRAAEAVAANEVAYGDVAGLGRLCDIADLLEGTAWLEYDPADRLAWYRAAGAPEGVGARGPMPDRIGIMAWRDRTGRIAIDHAYARDGRVEFSPWTTRVNKPGCVPGDEVGVALPEDHVATGLGPDEVEGRRALLARLSFTLNGFGRHVFARARAGAPDREEAMARETLCDAEEEATFALGMLALQTSAGSRRAN